MTFFQKNQEKYVLRNIITSLAPRLLLLFALLPLQAARSQIVINEIHYDPENKTEPLEFIELHNAGDAPVDLSGWTFSDGIDYTFPAATSLDPGAYLVVAENVQALFDKYQVQALGPFVGQLENDGERVVLREADGDKIDEVDYKLGFPWPTASRGDGSSMELIHPTLDNDLGGSWRASGFFAGPPRQARDLLSPAQSDWTYRKGTSEPTTAPQTIGAWRELDFPLDDSWIHNAQTPIGYGDDDDNTIISDMSGQYTTLYLRNTFTIDNENEIEASLHLRVYVDDGCIVWINGTQISPVFHAFPFTVAYNSIGFSHEAAWEEVDIPNASSLLHVGENIIAILALNSALEDDDFSIDAALSLPAGDPAGIAPPTPGRQNSIYDETVPPQIRQVKHSPKQPAANTSITITAKITDPDGIGPVELRYQTVAPGQHIPAFNSLTRTKLLSSPQTPFTPNPDFEDPANWTIVPMVNNGDDIYTAQIPPQINRTLVRYRIQAADAAGAAVLVPHSDDPSLNFALFVYNGVPPYTASTRSVHPEGVGHTYSTETLQALPVYHLLTRAADLKVCIGYSSTDQIAKSYTEARSKFNWHGTFVYEGVVYDHILYRLRQANDRYGGAGKRSMRFRFQKGHYLQAHDNYGKPYPTQWRTLNTSKMFDNKGVGFYGLKESTNNRLWNLNGAPAPFVHTFHFRVIDQTDEVPAGSNSQYYGDFWGMALAIEDYDARFLDAHKLEDGNLYKLKDQIFDGNTLKRNQGRYSVANDADFQHVRRNMKPGQSDDWINLNLNAPQWTLYHVVLDAVRHYDMRPADSHLKNRAWYFEPYEGSQYGRLWCMPHDSDGSWGTDWGGNTGEDYPKYAIFGGSGKPVFKQNYRNSVREFRDLAWTEDVLGTIIGDQAAIIEEFVHADRDRWRYAPSDAGRQDFGFLQSGIDEMTRFAFTGWSGPNGSTVPSGGRAKFLDQLAAGEGDAANIPNTPGALYIGMPDYPVNALAFTCFPFSDPQGAGTFAGMKWRIGEINKGPFDRSKQRKHEIEAVWESPVLTTFDSQITIPPDALEVGHTYRLRVRMLDDTDRWSHWSPPQEFTTTAPLRSANYSAFLRVSEIMYNSPAGRAMEFIELQNRSTTSTLDIGGVAFTRGIDHAFGSDALLAPGGRIVLTADPSVGFADFRAFHHLDDSVLIAGPYEGKLDHGGEKLTVSAARGGEEIFTIEYNDSGDWPKRADGEGSSIEIDENGLWRASGELNGSPGRPGDGPRHDIVINEILTHTDPPLVDAIELFNPTTATVDISGWLLSDSSEDYFKFRVPDNTLLAPRQYIAFDENDFPFAFDGAHGEKAHLLSAEENGIFRFTDTVDFGGAANGESFGRRPDGQGDDLYPMGARTFGYPNSAPRVGPLVLSEIHYHPVAAADMTQPEFIEIFNSSSTSQNLDGWRIRGDIDYDFPSTLTLPPGGVLVVTPFSPTDTVAVNAFLQTYNVAAPIAIAGPYSGSLDNGGGRITLQRPDAPPTDEPDFTPHLTEDTTRYDDDSPWPATPDGQGDSLNRRAAAYFGPDPASWKAAAPTPGNVTEEGTSVNPTRPAVLLVH